MTEPFYRPAALLRLIPVALAAALFGLLVPVVLGFGFLDPPIQLLYSCLGPFFLSRPLEKHPPAIAALWAWGMAIAVHAVALASLSGRLAPGYWIAPDWRFLAGGLMTGFGLTFVAAFLGARWGGATLRRVFLIMLFAIAFAGQLAPESVRAAVTSVLVPANALPYGAAAGILLAGLGLLLKRRGTL